MERISDSVQTATKPHYALLDGLRGVAALAVLYYHFFEGFATSPIDQRFNHGYLAVDFFFILSGFVIGYAYDDRWKTMKVKNFFKRRTHPPPSYGNTRGSFRHNHFPHSGQCPMGRDCGSFHFGHPLLSARNPDAPRHSGYRSGNQGNGEMCPLNGPSWSLFFEYIGNIMYAIFLHRLSDKWLKVFVGVCGASLAAFAIFNGSGCWNIGVGWTLADHNFIGGFLRMSFSFSAGLLISRNFRPMKIKGAFWICSALLIALLAVPHLGTESAPWLNGIYDSFCTLAAFPFIVWMGASGVASHKASAGICKFLGV